MNKFNLIILYTFFYITNVYSANTEPEDDRFKFYNTFGDIHLAKNASSVSVLVGEDLKGQLHDVIVVITAREDKITAHLKTFCGQGEKIADDITLSNYIASNVNLNGDTYECRPLSSTMNLPDDIGSSVKERFRMAENDTRSNRNSLYCIGFNLADGMVQIFDYNSIRGRFCPEKVKFTDDTWHIFYKNHFSKLILNQHAIRVVRKAFSDLSSGKKVKNYGFTRASHGYAMELLKEANIDFPQHIGGWLPTYDYLFITPMDSFVRKISYAGTYGGLRYYFGSSNRKKLKEMLDFGAT